MNESLTVYTLPNCMQFTMTKRALYDAGLPYVVVDLASAERAVETVQHLGYTSAPVVIVGAASWSGFRPDKIAAVASARATELYAVPIRWTSWDANHASNNPPSRPPRNPSDAHSHPTRQPPVSDSRPKNSHGCDTAAEGPTFVALTRSSIRYLRSSVDEWAARPSTQDVRLSA